MKVNLVGFDSAVFTELQLAQVQESAEALQLWVHKYEISPQSLELDEALEIGETKPDHIFTLAFAPASGDGFSLRYGLEPGLDESEEEFYASALPFSGDGEYPYTILDLACSVCDGEGESEGGDECENCEGVGDLSVDMFWDTAWNVTAEYGESGDS